MLVPVLTELKGKLGGGAWIEGGGQTAQGLDLLFTAVSLVSSSGSPRINVGWVDGWMGGWMEGWMDGWMNGRMDSGRKGIYIRVSKHLRIGHPQEVGGVTGCLGTLALFSTKAPGAQSLPSFLAPLRSTEAPGRGPVLASQTNELGRWEGRGLTRDPQLGKVACLSREF